MSDCKYTPLELVLSTTDANMYDADKKKWLWDGPLYWAVECLENRQYTISHNIVPKIPATSFLKIENPPVQWNYCLSKGCNKDSESMHIIFTFNPNSNNPTDYLQFVSDVYCHVTDFPINFIKDNSGKEWYINIVEVSKSNIEPYVELWIAESHPYSVLKTNLMDVELKSTVPVGTGTVSKGSGIWVQMAIIVGIVIFTSIIIALIFLFLNKSKSHKYLSELNIL